MRIRKITLKQCVLGTVLLLSMFYYLWGESVGSPLRIGYNFWLHRSEYTRIAKEFVQQDKLRLIVVSDGVLRNRLLYVNNCSPSDSDSQNVAWECTNSLYPEYSSTILSSLNAALASMKISRESLAEYEDFLLRHDLAAMEISDDGEYVEIEDSLHGLRYYKEADAASFTEDHEYLYVKKVDSHWFYYVRE